MVNVLPSSSSAVASLRVQPTGTKSQTLAAATPRSRAAPAPRFIPRWERSHRRNTVWFSDTCLTGVMSSCVPQNCYDKSVEWMRNNLEVVLGIAFAIAILLVSITNRNPTFLLPCATWGECRPAEHHSTKAQPLTSDSSTELWLILWF